ncbi:MAG: hypothetical protein KatS3mg114_0392 [Planctomycetaceae bacterium]|nr:MAG: hypothetical protein KatS3mg114_0392 [Planctomycetaceae bacterium]
MSTTAMVTPSASHDNTQQDSLEFEYRPLPLLVPLSVAFTVLSLTGFLWDVLLSIAVVGWVLAWLAWWQIKRSEGQYSGLTTTRWCLGLIPLIALSATAFHIYTFATEIPTGYRRVNFSQEISARELIHKDGEWQVDPEVQALDGQPIFVKGFMYPTQQTHSLKSFVLCKDSGQCCFGGNPKVTDMILVEMDPTQVVNYRPGLVAVAGVFRVHPTIDTTGLQPVYKLEQARHFSGAKTAY